MLSDFLLTEEEILTEHHGLEILTNSTTDEAISFQSVKEVSQQVGHW